MIIDLADPVNRLPHRAITLDTAGEEGCDFRFITFRGGQAPDGYGGVAVVGVSWVKFRNCIFEGNQADQGGVFHILEGTVYSTDCQYHLNIADQGGVAYLVNTAFFADLGLPNLFTSNYANDRGGVFACSESASGSIALHGSNVFWQNGAAVSGGVAYTDGTGPPTHTSSMSPPSKTMRLSQAPFI